MKAKEFGGFFECEYGLVEESDVLGGEEESDGDEDQS